MAPVNAPRGLDRRSVRTVSLAAFSVFGVSRLDRENDTAIEELIAPTVEAMGCAVVRVRLSQARAPVLQVMVERADGAPVTVDDCARISHAVSAALDVADPVAGSYNLEVSSPGFDRPLVRAADFERFAGREAKLETVEPVGGRRRFRGRLIGYADRTVRIELGGDGEVCVPFAAIRAARLVPAANAAGRKG